jgi:hypothetical protein
MKKVKLIHDGFNKPFTIAPYGKDEDTLSGRYRPMTSEEVAEFREDQAGAKSAKERNKIIVKAVHSRILKWDIEDELTVENIALLPPVFLEQLQLIITSYAHSGAEEDEKKS